MNIYLIGHKGPDLDTVVSAVAYKDFLNKKGLYDKDELIPLVSGEVNKETEFIFNKFRVEIPQSIKDITIESTDRFILVDHNEESQRAEGIHSDQVIEIIDHHKLNISFTTPVRVDTKPVGSTSTIIYEMYENSGLTPEKGISELLLSAILSDTVGLRSPLTTGIDSTLAHKLAENTGIDIEELTLEIFKAKSDIKGMDPDAIVNKDYKVFDFSGTKVFIGQVETVEPEEVLEQREALIGSLETAKVTHGASIAYLFITDILKFNSQALYATEEEKKLLEKAFTGVGDRGVVDVGPKISRKKDIAPAIEKALKDEQ
jgi:manganese-dependent inorganic pyrophosphatase